MNPMKIDFQTVGDIVKSPQISLESAKRLGYRLVNDCAPKYGLTDYRGIGWRVSKDGVSDGRSLGLPELEKSTTALIRSLGKDVYTSITEEGMFQLYIGIFVKD